MNELELPKESYEKDPSRLNSKNRIQVDHGIRDIYKHYKANTIKEMQQPFKVFKTILKELNEGIRDKILQNSEDIHLPCGLGRIRIKKRKMTFNKEREKLKVDWATSRKLKKTVYHLNDHTNGNRYRWFWYKRTNFFFNQQLKPYAFIPSRENKRALAKILKTEKGRDYWN